MSETQSVLSGWVRSRTPKHLTVWTPPTAAEEFFSAAGATQVFSTRAASAAKSVAAPVECVTAVRAAWRPVPVHSTGGHHFV